MLDPVADTGDNVWSQYGNKQVIYLSGQWLIFSYGFFFILVGTYVRKINNFD